MLIDFFLRSNARKKGKLKCLSALAAARFFKLRLSALLILLAAAVMFTAPARAQLDTSTISGVVSDSTGAVVPGATVVITDAKTNRSFVTTTNSRGEYFAPSLEVSVYRVKFSNLGFRTTTIDGIVLHANDSMSENAVLSVGTVSESITIHADEIQPDTETSSLGTTITADQVSQLPTNGRDIMDMLALVPGAIQNTDNSSNNASIGGFPSGQFGGDVLLDGGDSTRVGSNVVFTTFGIGNARITRSSIDNVQEVKVLSSDYSAEYGRAIGDIINIITKSGTNDLHGEVFEFLRNDAMDSKNYFDTIGTAVPLRLNQFGGNLGGPILRNKLFFFGNYEGERQRVTNISYGETLVLNDAMRASAVPALAPVIALIPHGTGPAQTVNHTIYSYWFDALNGTTYSDINENTYALKLDYVLSPKNNFAVRYNYNASNTYGTYGLAVGQYEYGRELAQLGKATWNYIGSATFLNELGFNINSPDSNQSNGEPQFPEWGCFFCNIGFGTVPGPNGLTFAARVPNLSYQLMDTATKIKGRNQFRFGADIRWNIAGSELVKQDSITYYGGPTVEAATDLPCNGQPQGTNGCVDPSGGPEEFLANNGEGWSVLGYPMTKMRNTMMAYFLNDDIKVRHNLAINLGIRYEFNTVLHAENAVANNFENFDVSTISLDKAGAQLYKPSYVDFAPRFGFNWDPYGKGLTAVKGGAGLFFLPIGAGSPLNVAQNTEENVSINILSEIFNGITCTPNITSVSYPLPTTVPVCVPQTPVNVNAIDPHERDSYSEQWSLAVDQQIAKNTVLTLAYRGNHGLRLPAFGNLNLAEPNCPAGETVGPNCPGGTAPVSGQALTYVLSNLWGNVSNNGTFASSNYNAFNAAIRTNTHGLNLQANYNWSHEFDDFMGLFESYQNPYNIKTDWSQGDIDVRSTFAIGGFYNAPRIPIRFTRLGTGWQLTTIVQGRTGSPVNFSYNEYDPASSSLRPDCVPGVSWRATNWSRSNQFNTAAFIAPKLAFGNCPRNLGRGTSYLQPDLGLVKNTKLTEHLNWEFRGEVFNVPNHPNFSNPGGQLNGYSFGGAYSTIGNLVGQGTSRQIQISSKLTF